MFGHLSRIFALWYICFVCLCDVMTCKKSYMINTDSFELIVGSVLKPGLISLKHRLIFCMLLLLVDLKKILIKNNRFKP